MIRAVNIRHMSVPLGYSVSVCPPDEALHLGRVFARDRHAVDVGKWGFKIVRVHTYSRERRARRSVRGELCLKEVVLSQKYVSQGITKGLDMFSCPQLIDWLRVALLFLSSSDFVIRS